MSTSAISSSVSPLLDGLSNYKPPSKQNALGQLGKDLQSGNLDAARSDFAVITGGSTNAPLPTTSQDPAMQDFLTLGKDLKSGDLAAAKKDYTTLVTDLKTELSLAATSEASSNVDTETKALLKVVNSFTASPSQAIAAYASNSGSTGSSSATVSTTSTSSTDSAATSTSTSSS